MVNERIALVAECLKKAGLEGSVKGSGLEFHVIVGLGSESPRTFDLNHKLLSRPNTQDALLERIAEIVDRYKEGLAARE